MDNVCGMKRKVILIHEFRQSTMIIPLQVGNVPKSLLGFS